MSVSVKKINSFFKTATKADVNLLLSQVLLTDRQLKVFEMFYIKGQNVGFIADTLNCCQLVINKELRRIRDKIERII